MNAVDFQDPFSAPHLRQKLMREDTNIRSSLIVSEVVGKFDSASVSRLMQDKCGATLLEVDASSKSAMADPRGNSDLLGIRLLIFPPSWFL